jgi:uncharacterized protein YciI
MTKYVLFYESADDVAEKAPVHFADHQARWQVFRERGSLLLIGPFTDLSGAMGVFTSRAAAEEFVVADPFLLHGVIKNWYIREWMEAIGTP